MGRGCGVNVGSRVFRAGITTWSTCPTAAVARTPRRHPLCVAHRVRVAASTARLHRVLAGCAPALPASVPQRHLGSRPRRPKPRRYHHRSRRARPGGIPETAGQGQAGRADHQSHVGGRGLHRDRLSTATATADVTVDVVSGPKPGHGFIDQPLGRRTHQRVDQPLPPPRIAATKPPSPPTTASSTKPPTTDAEVPAARFSADASRVSITRGALGIVGA